MSTIEPARPEHDFTTPVTRWVHTGIEAPDKLSVQGFEMVDTGWGVAYCAEIAHPERGVVGQISNEGRGGPTRFTPYDVQTFSNRDLAAFVARCRQDGVPMDPNGMGIEMLLGAAIDEDQYVTIVGDMRRNGQFLVRSYEPTTEDNYGLGRGAPLINSKPILRRDTREHLMARLAEDSTHQLGEAAFWQMFNGEDWVRLLPEPALTDEQTRQRINQVKTLHQTTTVPDEIMHAQRLDDGLYAFGLLAGGWFTLIGDTTFHVDSQRWCTCTNGAAAAVRFERWSVRSGLLESGTVHTEQLCRRLVTID